MTSDVFLDHDSLIHRLDARTKILVFLMSFIALVLFEHPLFILPVTFLIVMQISLAKAWINIWRIRFLFFMLILTGLIMWNIFASGVTHLWWFFDLESLLYTITRVLLICMMIFSGVLLISTTRNEELVLGMIQLGLPYRVGFAISTSLRLVPTIASSIFTISQAQRSRGLDLESGNIFERIKKYLPLLVPVFISSIRNTNVFGMALESKGFGARKDRSYYLHPIMSKLDYGIVIFYAIITIASIALDLMGYGAIPGLTKF